MSMSTEVAMKKTTSRQESTRQLKEAEWKKSFLRDCDTKSTESTTARVIQGAGEIPSAPKPAKPKKPREKKPVDSTPKKNAQRAKGSIALNKTIEQTDAEPKPEKRGVGEAIEKLSKYDAGSQICKPGSEEPKTPVPGQRRRKKAPREVGDKAERVDKKPAGKGKASATKEASNDSMDEETLEVLEEPVEVKSDEIRAVSTGFNSCSFFEKIQQGVKAYFSSRSSFNPEDAKKKEGGTRGSVDGVTEDVNTRMPGLCKTKNKNCNPEGDLLYDQLRFLGGESNSELLGPKTKSFRHFRKLKRKKLYRPKKYYVRIQIPRKGYFYRSTIGLRNRERTSSDSRGKTKADSKSQISELAPASFKATNLLDKEELNVLDSSESEVELVNSFELQNTEQPLHGFGEQDPAVSFEQSVKDYVETSWPWTGRDVGESAPEKIENFRQGGERQISAISENLHKIDSQETKYELFGNGESEYGFPSGDVTTTCWGSLMDSLQSSLRRDQFVYSLEVLQQPSLPIWWQTGLHSIEEEALGPEQDFLSAQSVRADCDKSDLKIDETSTLMGGLDLHLELENYLKAIESSPTTKSRTKNTLQCNFYDNYIPLQIYSSSQDLQGRVEEYYDVPENGSGSSFNSATSDCKELEEVANEVFLNVTTDQQCEFRNARSENEKQEKQILWRAPRETLFWGKTMDGYEKIYPIVNSRKIMRMLLQDSPAPVSSLPQRSSAQWSPTLQELIDIYNSVLKHNNKIRRNSLLGNSSSSSNLFSFLKNKLQETHCRRDLIKLTNELRNSHLRGQTKLGKPERGPPESVTIEEYVAMFQEILQSSLSINQITHLNDIISGLQSYSEKNYNLKRKLSEKFQKMREQWVSTEQKPKPPSQKLEEAPETAPAQKIRKKVRFDSSTRQTKTNRSKQQPGETTKPNKPRKSKGKSNSQSAKGSKKKKRKTRTQEMEVQLPEETEFQSQIGKEDILNMLFGMESKAKPPEIIDSKNKLLVNVHLNGSQVLLNGYSFFKNEDALSVQKPERRGNSELIIENVTRNEMPFDLWWKNTKSSRLRIMGKNSPEENTKMSARKSSNVTSAAKRSQEPRRKIRKVKTQKPSRKIENFEYSQKLLRAQHPIDVIAEVPEMKVSPAVEPIKQKVETKILLEDVPGSPKALREALKAALKEKIFSKDLICDLVSSEQELGKALNPVGKCPLGSPKRQSHANKAEKNQATTVRSMVERKKNPAKKPKGRKAQSRRNTILCYSTIQKIEKSESKKSTNRGGSPAVSKTKTKQTRNQEKKEVSKKISKEISLKWKRSNSTTRVLNIEAYTIPVKELTAEEKPSTKAIPMEILSGKEKPSTKAIQTDMLSAIEKPPTKAIQTDMLSAKEKPPTKAIHMEMLSVKEKPSTETIPTEMLSAKKKQSTMTTPMEMLSAKEKPLTMTIPMEMPSKEKLPAESIKNSVENLAEEEKQSTDNDDISSKVELLFSEGKVPDMAAEDPPPEDDLPQDQDDSFVSIQDKDDSPTVAEAKPMGSWFALLPPASCIDCVSLLAEMIHSDSFLVNFPNHGISQTKMKPLLKCNSDMKFYPGCVTEGPNGEKPLLTFVLTPDQQERAQLPENQVTVIRKESIHTKPGTVIKDENKNSSVDEENEKSLKSIEEFITYLSKSRKQRKSSNKTQKAGPKIQQKPLQDKVMTVVNRLSRSSISKSRSLIRTCHKRPLSKLDVQLNKKKPWSSGSASTKKKSVCRRQATDPILDNMIKNLSHALKCIAQRSKGKNKAKTAEKKETRQEEDILPEVVKAIKKAISTTDGIPHKEELISAIGDGLFRTKNVDIGCDSLPTKKTAVKIKIQCTEKKRKEVSKEGTKEEKPNQAGQPETVAKTDLLDSLVNRESWGGDLKRISSTYYDAAERTGGDQMSGDSIRNPPSVEENLNMCKEFGVKEENKVEFSPSDEQPPPKDVIENEETMYEKISKSLEHDEIAHSLKLLEAFLNKSELSDSNKLKKMLIQVQDKSKNIMLSMERKAWLKVLSSLDEIFLAFENEGMGHQLKGQLETTKQFIDKIQILNTKRLDALQHFCSSFVTSLQEEDDHIENVFQKLKRSLKQIKQKFTLKENTFPSPNDQDTGMPEEASESSSGIRIHPTVSLSNINDNRAKKKLPDDPQELKKKLQKHYEYLRQLTAEEYEFSPPEIQDVKEKVTEKLRLLEQAFECPNDGESSNMENYWGRAASMLRLARSYRIAEKDGEDLEMVRLDRSPGYVDLMRCLIKAWDTRTTMGSITKECFL